MKYKYNLLNQKDFVMQEITDQILFCCCCCGNDTENKFQLLSMDILKITKMFLKNWKQYFVISLCSDNQKITNTINCSNGIYVYSGARQN